MVMSQEQMLEKFSGNTSHPEEVKKFALMIFDGVNNTLKEVNDTHKKFEHFYL